MAIDDPKHQKLELEALVREGVRMAELGQALDLGRRIWMLKGRTIPDVKSKEFQDMLNEGRLMMERAAKID